MKNTKFLGIAAIVAAIVFTMSACAGMTLVSLDNESITGPAQVRQFGTISPSDITVYGFYKDDSRKRVTNISVVDFDGSRVGPQTVNVRTSVGNVSFQTEVMALNGISIASQPTKTLFKIGEDRNASWPGLVIRGDWNRMGSDTIPTASCQITGYSAEPAGRKTITVTYNGKTATFNVEVLGLTSIELERPPTKVDYNTGESLNLAGIVVQGNYGTGGNRIREAIPQNQLTASGYDSARVGQQRVTVTVRGQSTTFNVTVTQSINGTWVHTANNGTTTYRFNNGTYTVASSALFNGQPMYQGTYTAENGRITMKPTHIVGAMFGMALVGLKYGDDPLEGDGDFGLGPDNARLYTKAEAEALLRASGNSQADINRAINGISGMFAVTFTATYTLSGNTLTLTFEGGNPGTYTKR